MDSPSEIASGEQDDSGGDPTEGTTDDGDASSDAALSERCIPGEWDPRCLTPANGKQIDEGVTSGNDRVSNISGDPK